MAATTGLTRSAGDAVRVAERAAGHLGLRAAPPWHTSRAPITAIGDALTGCTGAWGRIAADVITLSRPEIAELHEPAGPAGSGGSARGASSTMPQKRNPVLSVLIRATARASPLLSAQLHLAAADADDERPAGSWHTEWPALRALARGAAAAGDQATELLTGLTVDAERMRTTVDHALPGILAERLVRELAHWPDHAPMGAGPARELVLGAASATQLRTDAAGRVPDEVLARLLDPADYLGTTQLTIDSVLLRAEKLFPEASWHPGSN
jgi:3-carboxy-cis,cis-muconate cycloisomerase